jgi:light-regulated signal transduction histidine kinase (bacteriophytochrome)
MSMGNSTGRLVTLVVPVAVIISIGFLDRTLGFGFQLFPLYLLPLAVVAWNRSLPATVSCSALAGIVILLKLFLTRHLYAQSFFWYWDALVKFSLLMLVGCGLWRIRQLQRFQQEKNTAKIIELNVSLQKQVEQLTAANNELAKVSYTISHDLRAPLRHVIGFAELLNARNSESLDEKSRHYLKAITQAGQTMASLIDGLLVFSQLGRSDLVKTRIDLNKVVRDILQQFTRSTEGREIEWSICMLPAVVGDADMLRLVISNLIANAIKFTQTRSLAKIEIGALDAADETLIYVKDNGVGFDGMYANKLFGMFQRLHAADEFEGSGVGLAKVQRIIVRHGGRVWAEGAVNIGAIFWFSLPKLP